MGEDEGEGEIDRDSSASTLNSLAPPSSELSLRAILHAQRGEGAAIYALFWTYRPTLKLLRRFASRNDTNAKQRTPLISGTHRPY